MKHYFPKSAHSQVEAIFHSLRAIRMGKNESPKGIRSFASWDCYRAEGHKIADYLLEHGISSLLDTQTVKDHMSRYLQEKLDHHVDLQQSRQTMEKLLSAMGKFSYALNNYIQEHNLDVQPLDIENIRREFYTKSKVLLRMSSRTYDSRAYPDPILLIENIHDGTYQLQAALQVEGGFRSEGVGAPRIQRLRNPLTRNSLLGINPDPVTGKPVGCVSATEKGGKETVHFVSIETYRRLETYIMIHGKLESNYRDYVDSINAAARKTGQYSPGKGSHAFKHCFAQRRYLECVSQGMSHEQALQRTSLEAAHYRLAETLTYTRGRK